MTFIKISHRADAEVVPVLKNPKNTLKNKITSK
jgi:hypothetical protein